jgi:hypothetical protein
MLSLHAARLSSLPEIAASDIKIPFQNVKLDYHLSCVQSVSAAPVCSTKNRRTQSTLGIRLRRFWFCRWNGQLATACSVLAAVQ